MDTKQVLKVFDDEIASLEQIAFVCAAAKVTIDPAEAIERLQSARAAVAQLVEDKERLDWLDTQRQADCVADRNGDPELRAYYWNVYATLTTSPFWPSVTLRCVCCANLSIRWPT